MNTIDLDEMTSQLSHADLALLAGGFDLGPSGMPGSGGFFDYGGAFEEGNARRRRLGLS